MSAAEQRPWSVPEETEAEAPDLQVIPRDPVEMRVWMDQRMEEIGEAEAEIERIRRYREMRIAAIRDNAESQMAPFQRRAADLRALVLSAAPSFPFPPKRKSIDLASGSVGTKLRPISIEITDGEKALGYAQGANLQIRTELVTCDPAIGAALVAFAHEHKVTASEEPTKSGLSAHVKAKRATDAKWAPDEDAGWSVNGGEDEPWVKINNPVEG